MRHGIDYNQELELKMTIRLNGEEREVADNATVEAILEQMRLSPQRVAVELNRRLLRTENYNQVLRPGDQLEIVTFVGGG
jgi:sulfur carrier protein